MKTILWLVLITCVPALELRLSIPWGILYDKKLHWAWVAVICTVANIGVGFAVFYLLEYIMRAMQVIPWVHRQWLKHVERTQKKIHAAVEKYGEWALAIFIGIPLPGTGAYSGALAANLLGMSHKRFAIANIIGVTMAGVIVTLACLLGPETFGWFYGLFIKKPA